MKQLKKVPQNVRLTIDLSHVKIIANDIEELLREFKTTAVSKNIELHIIPRKGNN